MGATQPSTGSKATRRGPHRRPSSITAFDFDVTSLATVRQLVRQRAEDAGFDADAIDDAVLAVNEVATNSVSHGGGKGVLRIWNEPGNLACEVRDRGRGGPRLSRRRPSVNREHGRGLWLADQLSDVLRWTSGLDGTVVQVRIDAPSV